MDFFADVLILFFIVRVLSTNCCALKLYHSPLSRVLPVQIHRIKYTREPLTQKVASEKNSRSLLIFF